MINKTSFNGAILQMLSHGLMTAMFFALIGMIYGRTGTRDIKKLGGLMKVIPFLAVMYVIAGLASVLISNSFNGGISLPARSRTVPNISNVNVSTLLRLASGMQSLFQFDV